jgi:hypothetical protein
MKIFPERCTYRPGKFIHTQIYRVGKLQKVRFSFFRNTTQRAALKCPESSFTAKSTMLVNYRKCVSLFPRNTTRELHLPARDARAFTAKSTVLVSYRKCVSLFPRNTQRDALKCPGRARIHSQIYHVGKLQKVRFSFFRNTTRELHLNARKVHSQPNLPCW